MVQQTNKATLQRRRDAHKARETGPPQTADRRPQTSARFSPRPALRRPMLGNDPLVPLTTVVAATTVVLAAAMWRKKKQRGGGGGEGRRRMRRSVSFTSAGLGIGTFPPSACVGEPTINAAVYFDGGCPTAEEVAEGIVRPLLANERMAQVPDPANQAFRPSRGRAGAGAGGEQVRPSDLVRTVRVDGDEAATHRAVFEHRQDGLGTGRGRDGDLPWWEILVVRNGGTGPSACVLRVHHVIGDGLALLGAFQRILTGLDGTTPMRSPFSEGGKDSRSSSSSDNNNNNNNNYNNNNNKKNALALAWSLVCATFHVLTLGATRYDHDTAFSRMNHAKMKHSGRREVLIFPTIPLDFVKRLKAAAGVTVNDLIMTAVSQAIHDYCKSQNDPVLASTPAGRLRCRALLPVGFPRSAESLSDPATALRNVWSMASCDIGVGIEDVQDRLRYIRSRTQELKAKPRAYMQLKVQNGLGPKLPVSVGQKTCFDTFSRHSLVLTNVPGPIEPVLFAGKPVTGLQLFFDNLVTQVDIISYAGQVYGNMVFDGDELPEVEGFGRMYAGALVALAGRLDVDVPAEVKEAAQV